MARRHRSEEDDEPKPSRKPGELLRAVRWLFHYLVPHRWTLLPAFAPCAARVPSAWSFRSQRVSSSMLRWEKSLPVSIPSP